MNETGCRPFLPEESQKIITTFNGRYAARDRAMFILGTKTGYRCQELLSLSISAVWDGNSVRSHVTVRANWMKGKRNERTMPINPQAADAIRLWLRISKMDHPFYRDWPLFCAQGRRKAITTRQAYSIIVGAAKAAGMDITRIGTHSCRKSFAAAAWEHPSVNKDMAKMAKLLGHANFSNTLRYLEFLDGSLERTVMEI